MTSPNPVDKLEELRSLILRREREQLGELRQRLDDKERRVREISGALPQAIKLSRERGGELTRALEPSVVDSIRSSLADHPEMFVEVLHPIIGSLVRRSIAESLRGLIQSLNKTLEHTFSLQGLKWRYEAFRTGKSFAEVVMLRSMVYRVEEVFLIHRETSLILLHVSADGGSGADSDLIAGMLSAIRDFARDALKGRADAALDEFRMDDMECSVASGRHAYLAAVIRGTAPRELRAMLEEAIETIHMLKGGELARFEGDSAVFESLRPELEACLREQYHKDGAGAGGAASKNTRAYLALAAFAGLVLFVSALAWNADRHWRDFLHRLHDEPGIAVTSAHHAWWGRSEIGGLRDPLAADPEMSARPAGLSPGSVEYDWKSYLALDLASVRRRFEQRFPLAAGTRIDVRDGGIVDLGGTAPYEWAERVRREGTEVPGVSRIDPQALKVTYDPALALARFVQAYPLPPGVTARVADGGALVLAGAAPYEWIAPAREGAVRLPGISGVSDTGLKVEFTPKLVLQRFTDRFGVLDTVNSSLQNGLLVLTGEASHGWLTRVRNGVLQVPGITSLDDRGLVDLDQQAFQQSKSVIESAFVYFLAGKDNFATEGFAALSRLPDEIRMCQTTARHIGVGIVVNIYGSADATGPEAKNVDLSQRRANAVRDFLVSCGLDASLFQPTGTGAPPPPPPGTAPPGKPVGEQSQRRVAFHVETRISSAPQ